MTHPIINKLKTRTVAYLQTPAGDADYKKLFPNDTETDIHRKAVKFLNAYINLRGRGSNGKWADLAGKLDLTEDYESVISNFKKKVEAAVNQLKKLALQSNNDVSDLSFFPFFCCCLSIRTLFSPPKTSPLLSFIDRRSHRCRCCKRCFGHC